jgi:hypothetical protein
VRGGAQEMASCEIKVHRELIALTLRDLLWENQNNLLNANKKITDSPKFVYFYQDVSQC